MAAIHGYVICLFCWLLGTAAVRIYILVDVEGRCAKIGLDAPLVEG